MRNTRDPAAVRRQRLGRGHRARHGSGLVQGRGRGPPRSWSESGKPSTSISKQVPLGQDTSLTLPSGYNIIAQFGHVVPVPGSSSCADLPSSRPRSKCPKLGQVCSPARRRRPPKTGCPRSPPSRNCSVTSLSPARSARPRREEYQRWHQKELVIAAFWSPPPPPRSRGMIDLRRNLAAMRSNSMALIGAACNFIVRGTPRSQ